MTRWKCRLRKLGLGYRRIVFKFSDKQLNCKSVENICRRVDQWGSATKLKPGSRRPRSARTIHNIKQVADLICSRLYAPGTSKSTNSIAKHLSIGEKSVRHIAKFDLSLGVLSCCISRDQRCNETEETGALRMTVACFSLMKRYFTSTRRWAIKMTQFGSLARNAAFLEVDFWFIEPSLHRM